MRRIAVSGGVNLHVRTWEDGTATPFLLVHGLASNARLWDGTAAALHAAGHPVAAIDLRGHGLSDKPDDGYDFATVTGDILDVVDGLGWSRPVVVGQSWGGNVVIDLAARHPGATTGVACVDGGTIDLRARFERWEECAVALAPPQIAGTPVAAIEAMLRQLHPEWPETGIQGALACFEVHHDGTVAPWLTRDRHLRILRALWEHDPGALYPSITDPVLLCPAADGDHDWTARKRDEIERAEKALAHCRVHWFSPSHHDIHAERPGDLAAVLHAACTDGFFA